MAAWPPITSAAQFFSFVEASPRVVVYVTAPWCFRCKQVADKVAGFPSDYGGVSFYCLDLEECEEVGDVLDIKTLPTFVLLRGGGEVARLEGVPQQRPARALAQAIRQHLLGGPADPAPPAPAAAGQGGSEAQQG